MFAKTLREVRKSKNKSVHSALMERLVEKAATNDITRNIPIYQKNFFINEELDSIAKSLDAKLKKKSTVED